MRECGHPAEGDVKLGGGTFIPAGTRRILRNGPAFVGVELLGADRPAFLAAFSRILFAGGGVIFRFAGGDSSDLNGGPDDITGPGLA